MQLTSRVVTIRVRRDRPSVMFRPRSSEALFWIRFACPKLDCVSVPSSRSKSTSALSFQSQSTEPLAVSQGKQCLVNFNPTAVVGCGSHVHYVFSLHFVTATSLQSLLHVSGQTPRHREQHTPRPPANNSRALSLVR